MKRFTPGPGHEGDLRQALGQFATGVTVITCRSDIGPVGITANSFASVSLDPPLVLWSPARASKRFPAFERAKTFAIHIVGEDQFSLCGRFAKVGDNFDGLDWYEGEQGVPLIEGCLARFECIRHAIHDGGDHAIIVGQVISASIKEGDPLVFSKGAYGGFTERG